jgi:hypothetical protein
VSGARARSAGPRAAVWRGLGWCTAVFGLVVWVVVAELSAPSAAHPMVPGWWVPPVALSFAGVLRVGYSAVAGYRTGRQVGAPGWLSPACVLLPPNQRVDWLLLAAGVLHAEHDQTGRRRQALGFVTALPATALISWTLWLHVRSRPSPGSES